MEDVFYKNVFLKKNIGETTSWERPENATGIKGTPMNRSVCLKIVGKKHKKNYLLSK